MLQYLFCGLLDVTIRVGWDRRAYMHCGLIIRAPPATENIDENFRCTYLHITLSFTPQKGFYTFGSPYSKSYPFPCFPDSTIPLKPQSGLVEPHSRFEQSKMRS